MKTKDERIAEVAQIVGSTDLATEMLDAFESRGGLFCVLQWPEQFSFFSDSRNVLDVLLEEKLV